MPTKTATIEVVLGDPQPKKHVVRFDSDDDDAAIANVYLSKVALVELGAPERIRLTIEAAS